MGHRLFTMVNAMSWRFHEVTTRSLRDGNWSQCHNPSTKKTIPLLERVNRDEVLLNQQVSDHRRHWDDGLDRHNIRSRPGDNRRLFRGALGAQLPAGKDG